MKIADLQAASRCELVHLLFSHCLSVEQVKLHVMPAIPSACQGGAPSSNMIILGGRGLKSLGTPSLQFSC